MWKCRSTTMNSSRWVGLQASQLSTSLNIFVVELPQEPLTNRYTLQLVWHAYFHKAMTYFEFVLTTVWVGKLSFKILCLNGVNIAVFCWFSYSKNLVLMYWSPFFCINNVLPTRWANMSTQPNMLLYTGVQSNHNCFSSGNRKAELLDLVYLAIAEIVLSWK